MHGNVIVEIQRTDRNGATEVIFFINGVRFFNNGRQNERNRHYLSVLGERIGSRRHQAMCPISKVHRIP